MTQSECAAGDRHDVQLALQAGGIGTWQWDLVTERMHWSEQLVQLLGRTPVSETPSFGLLLTAVHPDDRHQAAARFEEFRSRIGPLRLETRFLWPSGEIHWLVFLGETLANADGTPARMLGIVIDSTRRLRGEEAVRDTAERLRLAMHAGRLADWEYDYASGTGWWSPEAAAMHGLPPERTAITPREWMRHIHSEDRRAAWRAFCSALTSPGEYSIECRVVGADRVERWIAMHGSVLRRPSGVPNRMVGVMADITARKQAEVALRESEQRLTLATEAAGIGIWDWNLLDNSMKYSEQAKAICEFPPGEPVTYEMVRDVTHPEDLPDTSRLARRAIDPALREEPTFEYRLLLTNGRVRWVTAFGRAVFAEFRGEVRATRYIGTLQDITARKEAEQALAESESRLRLAIEAGHMAIWEHDVASDQLTGSPGLYRLLGFPDGAVPSIEAIRACYMPGEREKLQQLGRAALARGERFLETELAYQWPNGSLHWLMLRAELRGGQSVHTVGVLMDVTERRTIETALRETEARQRELLATIDLAAVFVRDWDSCIRFWSRGCERLYGFSASEAVGRSAHELLQSVFPIPFSEIEAALLQSGEWEGDVRQYRKDRSELTISMRKVLRRDSEGRPAAVLESVADVTRLREVEAQLRSLNEELEARVRAEVTAREAAQMRAAHAERMQALGQLAGGIAHDFNNVLQAIQGGASLISKGAHDSVGVQRFARMILDAADRGSSITRRLLAFARRGDLRAEPIDAAALLHGLIEVLGAALGAGVQIEVQAEPGLRLLADKGQLETALVNLATNARDAMPHGGTLRMAAAMETVDGLRQHPGSLKPGGYIRIEVVDTGQGMDANVLPRVLEPFFTTKPPGRGTGLGLPMVKGFVEQSGGGLAIDSRPGLGTTITLWLPSADTASNAARNDMSSSARGASARVLLVEDEPLVRELLAIQLEKQGYAVVVASTGEEAMALLASGENLHAMVTDLSMPGMDGLALIQAAQATRPGLPTVLLTGYAGDDTALALRGAISGSFSLLRKPVTGEQLADRVASLLQAQ